MNTTSISRKQILILTLVAILVGFLVFSAFGGDSLAIERERTNQAQIHETGITYRQALSFVCADNQVRPHAIDAPTEGRSFLSRILSTVAVLMAIGIMIGLLVLAIFAYMRRKVPATVATQSSSI